MGILDGILGPIGSLITGGLSFLGQQNTNELNAQIAQNNSAFNAEQAVLNRQFNSAEAQKTREFTDSQVQRQMDFQAYNQDTVWQRGVQDMQKAGLNPMLAYSQGGNPSSAGAAASGAQATGSAAQAVQPVAMQNAAGAGVAAAAQAAQTQATQAQTDNIKADTAVKEQQAGKVGWEKRTAELESDIKVYEQHLASARDNYALERAKAERDDVIAKAAKVQAEARLEGYKIPQAISESEFWRSNAGKLKPYTDYGFESLGKIGNSARNFIPASKVFNIFKGVSK